MFTIKIFTCFAWSLSPRKYRPHFINHIVQKTVVSIFTEAVKVSGRQLGAYLDQTFQDE